MRRADEDLAMRIADAAKRLEAHAFTSFMWVPAGEDDRMEQWRKGYEDGVKAAVEYIRRLLEENGYSPDDGRIDWGDEDDEEVALDDEDDRVHV